MKLIFAYLKIYKSFASIVPKSNPRYDKIHNLINQYKKII